MDDVGRTLQSDAASPHFRVRLTARGVTQCLGGAAAVLLAAHVLLQGVHYLWRPMPWLLLRLFDVDAEDSVPTWYSAVALLAAAGLSLVTAADMTRKQDRWTAHWYGLGIGFLLLSMDEIAGFHETLNTVISCSWTIPGLILSAGVGLCYVGFLYRLPRRTGVLMGVSAFMFLVGAAGIELVTDPFFADCGSDNLSYNLYNAGEEGLEMFGVVFFIFALLDYMGRGGPVRIGLRVEPSVDGRQPGAGRQ